MNQLATLGDLVSVQSGFAFKSKEYREDGHFLIRISNVQDGFLSLDKPKYVQLDAKTQRFALNEGDILVSLTGNIGRVARIETNHLPAALNQRVARLTIDAQNRLDSAYLFWFLSTQEFRDQLGEDSHGVAQQNVSPSAIKDARLYLPSLNEQRRVVEILDEAFGAIEKARENAERNLASVKELFDNHHSRVFATKGDGWEEDPLGKIADFKNGLNFNKHSSGQTLPIVGVGDFQDNFYVPIRELESATIDGTLEENYAIRKDDILTVRSNGSKQLIGRCMLVPDVPETTSYSGFVIRIRYDTSKLSPRFLLHFMKSRRTVDELTRGGGGANINNINQRKLSELRVTYPTDTKQQEAIADALDEVGFQAEQLEANYARRTLALDELKQSILQKAFTGQLTSKTPELELVP